MRKCGLIMVKDFLELLKNIRKVQGNWFILFERKVMILSLWKKILIWNSSLLTLSITNIILAILHIKQLDIGMEAYTNSLLSPIIIFSFAILGLMHLVNLIVTISVFIKKAWKVLLFSVGIGIILIILYFVPMLVDGPAFVI
jgi:hypothetical protein